MCQNWRMSFPALPFLSQSNSPQCSRQNGTFRKGRTMARQAKTALRKIIHIELPAHQQKAYLRLWTSRNDLEKARAFAKHILKKRLHQGHIRSKGAYFQSEA